MTKRANDGFTLVELLVSILAASIVTLAACTVLLLGVRINAQSTGVVTRQNTARVFMTALENMAAEGVIYGAETAGNGDWKVLDDAGNTVLSYNKEDGEISAKSGVLLKNVDSSAVTMEDSGLLTCTVETADGAYELSVYCRTVDTAKTEARNAKRNAFLQKLVSQFQTNDGEFNPGFIIEDGALTEKTYFKWYNTNWADAGEKGWCACFVSWALYDPEYIPLPGYEKWFAYVDDDGESNGFVSYLKNNNQGHSWKEAGNNYVPVPGDLIFFEMDADTGVDHVGAVISVAGGYVYTIEGSVEATKTKEDDQPESGTDTESGAETDTEPETETETIYIVQLKKYELSDDTILGYGVLSWDWD